MAKLNKGQAIEAVRKAVDNSWVNDADPRDLRLMSSLQLRQSAARVIDMEGLMPDTYGQYAKAVREHAITLIARVWLNQVSQFEDSDPAIIEERKLRSFRHILEGGIRSADDDLKTFMCRYNEDPMYAFEWGTQSVQAAATKSVFSRCMAAMEAGGWTTKTMNDLKEYYREQLRYSVRLDGSTSPMSNLVEQAKAIACMRLAGLKD